MTQEEAGKKLSAWAKYVEDPSAVPELDQPCTDDEIIEAMSIAGKALSGTFSASEGLEEAARLYAIPHDMKDIDMEHIEDYPYDSGLEAGFIAGAEWMKDKMLEGAVEGNVFMSFAPGHNQMVMADVDLPTNTKVKLIIVKEGAK